MTPTPQRDLDALDRVVALAIGWKCIRSVTGDEFWNTPAGMRGYCPSPTRDWTAFGEALLWARDQGLRPYLSLSGPATVAQVGGMACAAPDPRLALSKAIAAWKESR